MGNCCSYMKETNEGNIVEDGELKTKTHHNNRNQISNETNRQETTTLSIDCKISTQGEIHETLHFNTTGLLDVKENENEVINNERRIKTQTKKFNGDVLHSLSSDSEDDGDQSDKDSDDSRSGKCKLVFVDKKYSNKYTQEELYQKLFREVYDNPEDCQIDTVVISEFIQEVHLTAPDGVFHLLNRQTSKALREFNISEFKREKLEKFQFSIEISNLLPKHKGQEIIVEVLYTNTSNPNDFFTTGKTRRMKISHDSIYFNEDLFEINYLFERHQFMRLIVYLEDGTESELTFDVSNIVLLSNVYHPLDLTKSEYKLYTGNQKDPKKQTLSLKMNRITENLNKLICSLWVDFKFTSTSRVAKRFRYEIIKTDNHGKIIITSVSNELNGKGLLAFIPDIFPSVDRFIDVANTQQLSFVFYEGEILLGQIDFNKEKIRLLLQGANFYDLELLSKNQDTLEKTDKPVNKVSEVKQNSWFSRQNSKVTASNNKLPAADSPKNSVEAIEASGRTKEVTVSPQKSTENVFSKSSNKKLPSPSKVKAKDSNKSLHSPSKTKESSKHIKTSSLLNGNDGNANSNNSTTSLKPVNDKLIGKANIVFKEYSRKRFLDLVKDGLKLTLSVAIDFTSSNGDLKSADCLHTKNLDTNEYILSLSAIFDILKKNLKDESISAYGFGAIPPGEKEVKHCFNINNNKKNSKVSNLEDFKNSYCDMLDKLKFLGPAYFQDILKTDMDEYFKNNSKERDSIKDPKVKSNKLEKTHYHILLILTDGNLEDKRFTKDSLVEVAKLPMSVLIVGVGNGEFLKMSSLNSPSIQSSKTKELITRNIVKFERKETYGSDCTKLAEAVLDKIPSQVEEYFLFKGHN